MNKIIDGLLANRILTLVAAFAICLGGAYAWKQLDVEAYPDISDISVNVITQVNGLPAEEMEMQVTVPIERALNTVPGVISKRSRTIFGLSIIALTFEDKMDIYRARQLVLEKLSTADVPDGVKPELGPMTPSIGEIFRYVVEAPDSVSLTDIRELQDYVIIPRLLYAEGVIDVANFGGLVRQFQIVINPIQLEKYKLSVTQISESVTANNKNTGGNYLKIGSTQMNIRGVGRITKAEDIENIVVDNRNGVPILIKDIGDVEVGVLQPTGILGYHDKLRDKQVSTGIEGIILLRKFENPSNTIDNVRVIIDELNNDILPDGVRVEPIYDRTELVSLTIETVVRTLLEGMFVVFVILTLLLGNWRGAVISALAIPFSLLFAFIVMMIVGIPANLLSLGAIDFGIIVDASVVMIEALLRNLVHRPAGFESPNQTTPLIAKSSKEVVKQIFFSLAIIILAFLPIFSLQRVEGRLFSPMAYTLSFAIFGSMLYSLTVVPVLASYMLRDNVSEFGHSVWEFLQKQYARTLGFFIRFYKITLTIGGIFVFIGLGVASRLGGEFLPELDEGCVWVRVFLPAGISMETAAAYPNLLRKELADLDEVTVVLTQHGRNDDGTDPYGPNRIEMLVQLKKPYSTWVNFKNKKELINEIKRRLERLLPGVGFTISQPIIDTTTENATGSSADLAIFVKGKDLNILRELAKKILALAQQVQGNSESGIEQENRQTQLVVEVDRIKAARYGVNVNDVNAMLETAIGGFPVSQLYENERRFDILLRFTKDARSTPQSIGKLLVHTSTGARIPLSLVADIRLEEGQTIIFREEGGRQITVKTNIRGRDQQSFAAELNQKIKDNIKFPDHYSYRMGGQFENLQRANSQLALMVPVTLLLIFIMLMVMFNNKIRYPLIVMCNIPFAVLGGILALHFRGMNFNISAGIGFISLFGVAVMSGVLLISYLKHMPKTDLSLKDTVIAGAIVQLRREIVVMLIAIIGLIPAVLSTGIGSDVQRPLATVIVGGLCSDMLLSLFLLPIVFYTIEKPRSWFGLREKIMKRR